MKNHRCPVCSVVPWDTAFSRKDALSFPNPLGGHDEDLVDAVAEADNQIDLLSLAQTYCQMVFDAGSISAGQHLALAGYDKQNPTVAMSGAIV